MEDIMQEKISADHLLYVSLKYTKTCGVIKNLILRWKRLIEISMDAILEKSEDEKKIPKVPENPVKKIEEMRRLFKKDKNMLEILDMYEMFRKIETLRTKRIGEFRKNVNLRIYYRGKEINVDLEKLKEYSERLEKFISTTKYFLLS
jgi:hypothetical protein